MFALLAAASLCPVVLVPIPAMLDYPNHLARMYLLSRVGTADANPFYQVVWAAYPNLAMDLIVPLIARLIGVETATRIFYLLSQILVIMGAVTIERVVKGRFHIAGFFALIFLYSLPFAWGFVNFEFGLGIALCGVAAYLAAQERAWHWRFGINLIFVIALFAAHFFALGLYGFTIGLHEMWRAWVRKVPPAAIAARLAILAIPPAVGLGLMLGSGGAIGGDDTDWFLHFKPLWLFATLNGYSLMLSAVATAALLGMIYIAAKRGLLRFEPAGTWLAAGFALLYLAMPSRLFATSFVDVRVIVAAALILPPFVSLSLPDRRWRLAAACGAIVLILANLAMAAFVWMSYRADYAAMIDSFGKIDKGAFVLIAHSGEADDPPMKNLTEYPIYNAPTLAVHYADAFVPTFYAAAGKQPVIPRPAYRRLQVPYGGIAPIAALKAIAEKPAPDAPDFVRSWPRDFDYLYVIGPAIANPMPNLLDELYAAPRFALYKIRK
ncbi:MAG: hypothetical protein JO328_12145 [Hyphomicrobiales bacterium]|nr:hypothetical protein [Hyphomicrobiales bacterium]MBV8826107.1 hypothetical protein [Hyphomicrobiales bacterium]MBV9429194.1 hypothetical protein [Bradyrhizobiaceae bacterium]